MPSAPLNDTQPPLPDALVVPHERQVIDACIVLWREDPLTELLGAAKLHARLKAVHPEWLLLEKRLKTLLKNQGLLTTVAPVTYAGEITSLPTPHLELPPLVRLQATKKSGKGLYAKKRIAAGTSLWQEKQLFFVPPLAQAALVRSGKACALCLRLLQPVLSGRILHGLECNVCAEAWCSRECKAADALHANVKHSTGKAKVVDANAFEQLEKYALANNWSALYGIAWVRAEALLDKTGVLKQQFEAMARVSQAVRHKALDAQSGSFDASGGGALFVQEQQETLWKEGWSKLNECFGEKLDYDEFLWWLGTYNINNIDLSLFLVQLHLNHNCDPNVLVKWGGKRSEGIEVVAKRDILAGEELTTSYVAPTLPVGQRKRALRVNWGFVCGCRRCKEDERVEHRRMSQGAGAVAPTVAPMEEFELAVPDAPRERRKSVRFDQKVELSE